jgi:hypothetical protein
MVDKYYGSFEILQIIIEITKYNLIKVCAVERERRPRK